MLYPSVQRLGPNFFFYAYDSKSTPGKELFLFYPTFEKWPHFRLQVMRFQFYSFKILIYYVLLRSFLAGASKGIERLQFILTKLDSIYSF